MPVISVVSQITFLHLSVLNTSMVLRFAISETWFQKGASFITSTKFWKTDHTIVNKHRRGHPPSQQDC
jgi:hypothetical protein